MRSSLHFQNCQALDVRDLGGHLDFTRQARASTLSRRVREAARGVAAVGALPLVFQAEFDCCEGEVPCRQGCTPSNRRMSLLLLSVPFVPLLFGHLVLQDALC